MNTKIIFFPVQTTPLKLAKICEIGKRHFEGKDPLLFLLPDQTAYDFLDRLLWASPPESFLPHPSKLIHLSLHVDPAYLTIFNLCPTPLASQGLKTIYEIEDHTSPDKRKLSELRYHSYKEQSLQIIYG